MIQTLRFRRRAARFRTVLAGCFARQFYAGPGLESNGLICIRGDGLVLLGIAALQEPFIHVHPQLPRTDAWTDEQRRLSADDCVAALFAVPLAWMRRLLALHTSLALLLALFTAPFQHVHENALGEHDHVILVHSHVYHLSVVPSHSSPSSELVSSCVS